ncbi:Protein FAR-RED IMPAIRED RESPONSE 1 [Bienertia sinuspersici]
MMWYVYPMMGIQPLPHKWMVVTVVAVETRGTPKKGMTFDSLEALEKFYSSYGKACGFGVILVGAKKDENTNVKRWQYWHCECGPGTSTNQVVNEGDPKGAKLQPCKRRRKSKKIGCEVGIAGYLNKDGLWEIHKVELTYKNHVPTPSKSQFIPSYRDVPKFVLRVGKDLMDAGFKQSQMYHALANQMNGFENPPFLLKDMHNVVGKERSKEFDETDYRVTFEYFAKMKEANDDFFFSWRVDELECMGGVHPGGIITDQSVPTAKAIQQVLSDNRHRLFVWYIISKVLRKLLAVKKVGEVHKKMKDVVYDSLSIEEFESRWIELIRSFKLEGNEWLNSHWEEQSRWVPAYVKDTFCAGMSTTQRVESIHHFFKGFMNAKTTLREFVQKYTRAIEFRANEEKVVTANDDRRKTKIKSTLMVERFFQKIYTDDKFKEVQTECLALIYVLPGTEVKLSETVTEYTLIERIQVGDPIRHVTRGLKDTVDMEKLEFNCTLNIHTEVNQGHQFVYNGS